MSPRILVAGGYGVFGALLAREILRTSDAHVVVAGRSSAKAMASITRLGPRASAMAVDLHDLDRVRECAQDVSAIACAAGPFQELPRELPRLVAETGTSWLDIADEPSWVNGVLGDAELSEIATANGAVVSSGLSSVPAISGLLARVCLERLPAARRARVTLFIGNKNTKGAGAIASAMTGGFRDPVEIATPAGRYRAYRFPSPDETMLRDDLGLEAEFRVALEIAAAGRAAAALGRVTRRAEAPRKVRLARLAATLAAPARLVGRNAGLVQVELWDTRGRQASACAIGEGQRLAIVPCAAAAIAAASGWIAPGTAHPVTWLRRDEWLTTLHRAGILVVRR